MIPAALISIARFFGFGPRPVSAYVLAKRAECASLARERAELADRIAKAKKGKKRQSDLQSRLDYLTSRQLCIEVDLDAAETRVGRARKAIMTEMLKGGRNV